MDDPKDREVVVRTHGGFPRIRILWEIEGRVALVVEERHLDEVKAGDRSWIVGVPVEDVFVSEPATPIDPGKPFERWDSLRRIAA